ncbi:tryptophan 7-halogenase [Halioglobus sp.]|nr:tryptophan 7-halogenase [Halioglobus sp.]
MPKRIAIIGAGPSGSALACFLAQRGIECFLFDDNRKPTVLVGESLIPAAIPIIRRLGLEDKVSAISHLKLGAGLRHADGSGRVDFAFQKLGRGVPQYAYNIPRPQFDELLVGRAKQLGVNVIHCRAGVTSSPANSGDDSELRLDDPTLAAAGLTRDAQPDLLIDATGRARLFSHVLDIGANRGPRSDVAHFAHFENYANDIAFDGQILITVLECGWSWQIPLRGKTSVGVVLNGKSAQLYGQTAAERLDNIMAQNSLLKKPGFKRVTDVNTYANYQLVSQKVHGKGWVLVGDALGFVDPMLSPGVSLALECSALLDKLIFKPKNLSEQKTSIALDCYHREMLEWHSAWSRLIEYFYDGRLLSLGKMHTEIHSSGRKFSIEKMVEPIISNVISRLISGAGTRSRFNMEALFQTCSYLASDTELLAACAIRDAPLITSNIRSTQSEGKSSLNVAV